MALRSAWELQRCLAPVSREWRSGMSSRTPRGKPLKPVDLISLSGPTITAPTRRPLSLLQWAIWWASIMKRWSQVLENIECPRSKRSCTPTFRRSFTLPAGAASADRLRFGADDHGRLQIGHAATNRRIGPQRSEVAAVLAPAREARCERLAKTPALGTQARASGRSVHRGPS